ncbi:MAG: hypothetical protein ABI565_08335 [Vicinamibacteria bacterium]
MLEIPDEWWAFSEMNQFDRDGRRCFNTDPSAVDELVEIQFVEPPVRAPGVAPFKKARLVPILMGIVSSSPMPPIEACRLPASGKYRFRLYNGFHRFYASVAAGFPMIPVKVLGNCE